jgi:hypothetical protein
LIFELDLKIHESVKFCLVEVFPLEEGPGDAFEFFSTLSSRILRSPV